ncbi:MAG: hypothetical protein J3R72DRAFT_449698 [Linnemannia gamsii]|nr:MAG: hypothetical protein J3R72DRAFT_449698 [Linnemannia gamsii]
MCLLWSKQLRWCFVYTLLGGRVVGTISLLFFLLPFSFFSFLFPHCPSLSCSTFPFTLSPFQSKQFSCLKLIPIPTSHSLNHYSFGVHSAFNKQI